MALGHNEPEEENEAEARQREREREAKRQTKVSYADNYLSNELRKRYMERTRISAIIVYLLKAKTVAEIFNNEPQI